MKNLIKVIAFYLEMGDEGYNIKDGSDYEVYINPGYIYELYNFDSYYVIIMGNGTRHNIKPNKELLR